MKKDVGVYLDEILDSINSVEEYVKDQTIESFSEDGQAQDAVIRRIEIIGEVVKRSLKMSALLRLPYHGKRSQG